MSKLALIHPTNTAAAWLEANPILFVNEIGFESDTNRMKIGDGVTPWAKLPYSAAAGQVFSSGNGVVVNGNTISAALVYEVVDSE